MSNIDYTQICPEFYTNYEDGCCMENCTFESKGYCPVRYVKGLLEEKDKVIENWQTMYESVMQTCGNDAKEIKRIQDQLALTEKALELACEELYTEIGACQYCTNGDFDICSAGIKCQNVIKDYFKTKAKEMMKSE
jgi:hypothetical protein